MKRRARIAYFEAPSGALIAVPYYATCDCLDCETLETYRAARAQARRQWEASNTLRRMLRRELRDNGHAGARLDVFEGKHNELVRYRIPLCTR